MDDYEKQLAAWRHRQGIKPPKKVKQATAKLPSGPDYAPAIQAAEVMKMHRENNRRILGDTDPHGRQTEAGDI